MWSVQLETTSAWKQHAAKNLKLSSVVLKYAPKQPWTHEFQPITADGTVDGYYYDKSHKLTSTSVMETSLSWDRYLISSRSRSTPFLLILLRYPWIHPHDIWIFSRRSSSLPLKQRWKLPSIHNNTVSYDGVVYCQEAFPDMLMIMWEGPEMGLCCLPQVPGWGIINLSHLFTHHLLKLDHFSRKGRGGTPYRELDPYPLGSPFSYYADTKLR